VGVGLCRDAAGGRKSGSTSGRAHLAAGTPVATWSSRCCSLEGPCLRGSVAGSLHALDAATGKMLEVDTIENHKLPYASPARRKIRGGGGGSCSGDR